MITVLATREGLIGQKTASGYIVDGIVPFVALPSFKALFKFIKITHGNISTLAIVLDVGPWNEHDDQYVFMGARPMAESGTDTRGRTTNKAGIDLSERIWHILQMKDNTEVSWEFIG